MKKYLIIIIICIVIPFSLSAQVLMLYGGKGNNVFLGTLNTNKYDTNSIWNQYGNFGSKYSSNSIWNQYGTYGSIYNAFSPWNQYSSTPPAIVDKEGRFYGYFTKNKYFSKRTTIDWALWILDNYENIKDDTSIAYDELF